MDNPEKMEKMSVGVEKTYVNPAPPGKWIFVLWKNLWRMWKTLGFQQINFLSPQAVENTKCPKKVENLRKIPHIKGIMLLESFNHFPAKNSHFLHI